VLVVTNVLQEICGERKRALCVCVVFVILKHKDNNAFSLRRESCWVVEIVFLDRERGGLGGVIGAEVR